MADSNLDPTRIEGEYPPLETLIQRAVRRFGDHSATRMTGDTMQLMVELANEVVEEVNSHPYWVEGVSQEKWGVVDYYRHQSETRPIPSIVMLYGLTAHLAVVKGSEKAATFMQLYYNTLNKVLWNRLNDGSNPRMYLRTYDKEEDRGGTVE